MVRSSSRRPAAERRAFGRRSLVSSTKQLVMREAGALAGPGCGVAPQPVHHLAAKCGLTLRSSGPPPAWHLGREPFQVIIRLAAQAPTRRGPLSSNVRPNTTHSIPRLPWHKNQGGREHDEQGMVPSEWLASMEVDVSDRRISFFLWLGAALFLLLDVLALQSIFEALWSGQLVIHGSNSTATYSWEKTPLVFLLALTFYVAGAAICTFGIKKFLIDEPKWRRERDSTHK